MSNNEDSTNDYDDDCETIDYDECEFCGGTDEECIHCGGKQDCEFCGQTGCQGECGCSGESEAPPKPAPGTDDGGA